MNLEMNRKESSFTIGDTVVKVDVYKSTYEKQSIIDAALQNAYNEKTQRIDRMIYDSTFYALIVLRYTDLKFEGMEEMQICDLYDLLETNGVIEKTIQAISDVDNKEVKELFNYADVAYEEFKESLNSAGAAINSLVVAITQSMATAMSAAKVIEDNK